MLAKIYITLLGLLFLPAFLFQSYSRQAEVIDVLVFVVASAGYVGYILDKKLLFRLFWQAFALGFIGWEAYYRYCIPMTEFCLKTMIQITYRIPQFPATQTNATVLVLVLFFPLFNGLLKYAFERDFVWK